MRNENLKRRVLNGLRTLREFKELKFQMIDICISKYEEQLVIKSFYSLFDRWQFKSRMSSLLQVFSEKHTRRNKKNVLNALEVYKVKSKIKKVQKMRATNNFNRQTIEACFEELKHYSRMKRGNGKKGKLIRAKHESKLVKHLWYTMLIQYNKSKLTNQLEDEVC